MIQHNSCSIHLSIHPATKYLIYTLKETHNVKQLISYVFLAAVDFPFNIVYMPHTLPIGFTKMT